jgi:hypothetical protein
LMMDHREAIDTLAAERYVLGDMTSGERDAYEAHFFSCPECADDVKSGALMKDGVREGLIDGKRMSVRRGVTWRPAVAIPWAAAATLAVIAGYESVPTRSSVDSGAPIALAPVTLRPETRGQDPIVSAGPGGAVTLAIPLHGSYQQSVSYELRSDARTIASAEVTSPSPGAPLLLLIPSGLLSAGGHYILVVKDPRSRDLTSEEYRFTVESR